MARYEPGTRYSNSVIYDEATDRANEFGDTIFAQKREDGTPTGREAVVVGGRLITLEVAGKVHDELVRQAAPELLKALEFAQRLIKEALPKFNWGASFLDANAIALLNEAPAAVNAAIAKARG